MPNDGAALWIGGSKKVAAKLRGLGAEAICSDELTREAVMGRRVIVAPSAAKRNPDAAAEREAKRAVQLGALDAAVVLKPPYGVDVADYVEEANGHATLAKIEACAHPFGNGEQKSAATHSVLPTLIVRTMSDVKPERLEWLDVNGATRRYARGKVTLYGGDPGGGKSLMCTSDEAAITQNGGRVIVFSAEDDAADTMRPRYDAAGANPTLIMHVDGVRHVKHDGTTERHAFNLERDIATLRALLAQYPDTVFVRIDPITAYLGRIDSHKNAEVRALLAQLEEIAREFRVAIAVVTHLNKNSTGPALYRFVS